jgi:hypothetical protein
MGHNVRDPNPAVIFYTTAAHVSSKKVALTDLHTQASGPGFGFGKANSERKETEERLDYSFRPGNLPTEKNATPARSHGA